MSYHAPAPESVSLMAAGELRDALDAARRGDHVTAVSALMAIDPASWQAIEHRLAALGGSLPEIFVSVGDNRTRS